MLIFEGVILSFWLIKYCKCVLFNIVFELIICFVGNLVYFFINFVKMFIGFVVIKKYLLKLLFIIFLIMFFIILVFFLINCKCVLFGFWGVLVVIIIKFVFL